MRHMASTTATPRVVLSSSRYLYSSFVTSRCAYAIFVPPRSRRSTRTFTSSTASLSSTPKPISEKWETLSVPQRIQWILKASGDAKWGSVIYRCAYKPELNHCWEKLKRLVQEHSRQEIAESDTPEIADSLDWIFVEDPGLEGATLDDLKKRFRSWALAEIPHLRTPSTPLYSRGVRYRYFIQVDEDSLRSMESEHYPTNTLWELGQSGAHVVLVRAWQDSLPPGEATNEFGDAVDAEDCIIIQPDMLEPLFFVEMDNDDLWYVIYTEPPGRVCYW